MTRRNENGVPLGPRSNSGKKSRAKSSTGTKANIFNKKRESGQFSSKGHVSMSSQNTVKKRTADLHDFLQETDNINNSLH